ncbi:MAG TPA: efflux RND transporter periplasmic adaptor subunit, partial [Thermohalobaculum sp.]|nr:efflux RND transporter periplasmic adaptor subunit [Thermohalobaculum sp.]
MARKSTYIAAALVVGITGWMASGMMAPDEPAAPAATNGAAPKPVTVDTAVSRAEPVQRSILVQGDTRAYRSAGIRSEADGRIESIAVEEGQTVAAGDPIMTLALDERASRLAEAEARLEQRQADYDAGISLQEKGYATAERIRELRSALEEARAEVATIEQQVADTTILAPFDGVVDEIERRVGEVVELGEEVATLIDNAPLRVEVRVPQQSISRVEVGAPADVQYATGAREAGRVCVISVAADPGTRTFRVEVRTPNADRSIPSGISAEVRIPTGEIEAHFLTPAILSLNDDGRLGVKTVSPQNTVQFHTVSIVQARADGIWLTGLPDEARVITVGQG